MPIESRAGYSIYWQTVGGGQVPALALHCSLASSDTWRGVASALDGKLALTAPDLIGHGRSNNWDKRGDFHTACTQVAASFLDQPIHVIGHSFGATVALRLAIEYPQRVKTLTLIEPVFFAAAKGTPAYDRHLTEFTPFENAMKNNDLDHAARIFTEVWGTGVPWGGLPEHMRGAITKRIHLIPATVDALYADNAGLVDRLGDIGCPVQLIEGGKSPEIIAAIGQALQARIPDVRRDIVDGASHMVPITHAQGVASVIERFWIWIEAH